MADDVNSTIRNPTPSRLVVGISGASGVIYGARVLDALRELGVESHLVVTKAALLTLSQETDFSPDDLMSKADVTYKLADVGAALYLPLAPVHFALAMQGEAFVHRCGEQGRMAGRKEAILQQYAMLALRL